MDEATAGPEAAPAPEGSETEVVATYNLRVTLRKAKGANLKALTLAEISDATALSIADLGFVVRVSGERTDI